MKEVKVMINGEETTISYNTYQRIKDIAKSRKLTMAGAISYCLQKVLRPRKNI